jgi:RNA polymerase sigma factor (sigma-70 family)
VDELVEQEAVMNRSSDRPSSADLALLARTIRNVSRARRLSRQDAQDFAQTVQLRLLERNYDIFQRCECAGALPVYLRVVVTRMLFDWRDSVYGKWRSSAAAKRLGEHAVALERLIYRDGFTAREAAEILSGNPGSPGAEELRRVAAALPARCTRRAVSDEGIEYACPAEFDDPVERAEQRRAGTRTLAALDAALSQLPPGDRWLIEARYERNQTVSAVAEALRTESRPLYRRFNRVLGSLRRSLVAAGVTAATALEG